MGWSGPLPFLLPALTDCAMEPFRKASFSGAFTRDLWRWGRRVRARQQALVDPPDLAVAFATRLFEPRSIGDGDTPAALPDQPCCLESARDDAHRGTLHPQHLGQKLVREGQCIPISPVMHVQDPAAAAGFNHMNRIARDCLEGLRQQDLAVVHDQLPKPRAGVPHLVQALKGNARGGAAHLHNVASESLPGDQGAQQAQDALAPEHSYLDATAILHDVDQRDDRILRKVDVENGVTWLIEHLTAGEGHSLKVRLQSREVSRLQSGEKPVRAMIGFRILGHGNTIAPYGQRA